MTPMLTVFLVWLTGFGIFEILQWKCKIFGIVGDDRFDRWFVHAMCAIWPYQLFAMVFAVSLLGLIWLCDKLQDLI